MNSEFYQHCSEVVFKINRNSTVFKNYLCALKISALVAEAIGFFFC